MPRVSGAIEAYYAKMGAECAVMVTPRDKPGMIYRSYLFTDSGQFQIFNSFNDGDSVNATGVRSYFLLPRQHKVIFKIQKDGDLLVELASGSRALISARDGRLKNFDDLRFEESIDVTAENRGGVEILESKFLFIDAGFQFGDSPYSDPDRISSVHDRDGRICDIQNSLLFSYPDEGPSKGPTLKPDTELSAVLAKQCPMLERLTD